MARHVVDSGYGSSPARSGASSSLPGVSSPGVSSPGASSRGTSVVSSANMQQRGYGGSISIGNNGFSPARSTAQSLSVATDDQSWNRGSVHSGRGGRSEASAGGDGGGNNDDGEEWNQPPQYNQPVPLRNGGGSVHNSVGEWNQPSQFNKPVHIVSRRVSGGSGNDGVEEWNQPQFNKPVPVTLSSHDGKVLSPNSAASPAVMADDRSVASSEVSYKSNAMKGAQELLKQNRKKRLEIMAKRRAKLQNSQLQSPAEEQSSDSDSDSEGSTKINDAGVGSISSDSSASSDDEFATTPQRKTNTPGGYSSQTSTNKNSAKLSSRNSPTASKLYQKTSSPPQPPLSPTSTKRSAKIVRKKDDDATECSSLASNPSSVWTEDTNNVERNSRRALILQMAKNRMKGREEKSSASKRTGPKSINEDKVDTQSTTRSAAVMDLD